VAGETPEPKKLEENTAQKALHFAWASGGPIVLALLVVLILRQETLSLGLLDAAFWTVVFVIVACRAFEAHLDGGRTAEGMPAGATAVRRYALSLILAALVGWVAVHAYGYYVLGEQGKSRRP
jgi:hypothetical protein